jgi:hypothetical protein
MGGQVGDDKDNLPEYPKRTPESIFERTLEAAWCVDNETGESYLLDLKTGKVVE